MKRAAGNCVKNYDLQLDSIFKTFLHNVKNVDEYLNNCINIMFSNQLLLKENKRLNTQEDKEKLVKLKTIIKKRII